MFSLGEEEVLDDTPTPSEEATPPPPAEEATPPPPEEATPPTPEEATPPTPEETTPPPPANDGSSQWSDITGGSDISHLTVDNFNSFITEHDSVLVMFYAPCKSQKFRT